jgi:hypothetical protein
MIYMIGLRIFAISMRSAILSILFILSRTEYSTDVLALDEHLLLNRVLAAPHARRLKPRTSFTKPASAGYPSILLIFIRRRLRSTKPAQAGWITSA